MAESNPAEELEQILGNFSSFAPRIKHKEPKKIDSSGRSTLRFSYMSFRDGKPTFDDFINTVYGQMIAFCIPRTEIKKATDVVSSSDFIAVSQVMTELSDRARNLFMKARKGSHRSGEAGEIILFIFTEWLLRAPQIVSKMYLKTNHQMPIHGTDGIHAKYDEDKKKLYLYWGESKAHATLDSALKSAISSISDFLSSDQVDREIQIIHSQLELEGLSQEAVAEILKYLNPYEAESNNRVIVHSCLLIFERKSLWDGDLDKEEEFFLDELNVVSEDAINKIQNVLDENDLKQHRFEFFLLPVPSVQDLRDKFQEKVGMPK